MAAPAPTKRPTAGRLALALVTALILLFLVAPIAVVFPLSLSSGELLVLPLGWKGEWTIHEHTRKLYVLHHKG